MKKNKIISVIFVLTLLLPLILNACFATLGKGFNEGAMPSDNGVNPVKDPVEKIWGTVLSIMQVVSVAGVVFMGVRYMFASASDKANIKNSTIYGIIGIVMVFAVSTVIKYLTETAKGILQ